MVISLWPGDKERINGVAHSGTPRPQKFRVQKSAGKFLASNLFRTRQHTPHWLSSNGPNYQQGVLLISAGAIEGHFEGKTQTAGRSPRGSCSCTTMPQLTVHLQTRRNWRPWASNVLITHPILQIWPRRNTTCSLELKTIECSPFFVRRGGNCCRGHLVGRTTYWFSLISLQKLVQRAKKCVKPRGEHVE